MSALIERCKAAYAANNIPWDKALEDCGEAVIAHLTDAWEARAQEAGVYEGWADDNNTIREAKRHLQSVLLRNGLPKRDCRGSFAKTWATYHGSGK